MIRIWLVANMSIKFILGIYLFSKDKICKRADGGARNHILPKMLISFHSAVSNKGCQQQTGDAILSAIPILDKHRARKRRCGVAGGKGLAAIPVWSCFIHTVL